MALFVRPGQTKPSASHQEVAQRYEICEDMANLLTEHAQSVQFSQGLETHEVPVLSIELRRRWGGF